MDSQRDYVTDIVTVLGSGTIMIRNMENLVSQVIHRLNLRTSAEHGTARAVIGAMAANGLLTIHDNRPVLAAHPHALIERVREAVTKRLSSMAGHPSVPQGTTYGEHVDEVRRRKAWREHYAAAGI